MIGKKIEEVFLALVIVLDKFPKIVYEDTEKMFFYEEKASQVAYELYNNENFYLDLAPIERFFCMFVDDTL